MDRQEAIKIVKSNLPEGRQMLSEALEFLIPELKKSDDEKIRRTLINYFGIGDIFAGLKCSDIVAYLKKQGEKKPVEWSEQDQIGLDSALWCVQKARESNQSENDCWLAENWLKSFIPTFQWCYVTEDTYIKGVALAQRKVNSDVFGGYCVVEDHILKKEVYERYAILVK